MVMAHIEIERHVSSDGCLTLIAFADEAGDITCGFENMTWHAHGDQLDLYGVRKGELSAFVSSILNGNLVIGVVERNSSITEAWVVSAMDKIEDDHHRHHSEAIVYRLWNGTIIAKFQG